MPVTTNLLEGIRNAFPLELFPWDDYFLRMAEADWKLGRANVVAAKSYFIRKAPFQGAYALLGGITAALRQIHDLRFNIAEFLELADMGYDPLFIEELMRMERLRVEVYAPEEGTAFFPNEPIVSVRGHLLDVRLAEGIITEALNFASLVFTKWHRLVQTVSPGKVLEFGRRRSQNALKSSLYGILAGCFATSNAELRRFFNCRITGTMGHEWVQSFGDVACAFEAWLTAEPSKPIGLVDTKQCLTHDFPLWLDAVYSHREAIKAVNPPFWGWRNDSGDLASLSMEQYRMFLKHPLSQEEWFRKNARIVLTNDLDEYSAAAIISQIRGQKDLDWNGLMPRIIWAAGTKPSTCEDQSSIGGVMKLASVEGKECIKLAFDDEGKPGEKTSTPGFNHSAIIHDKNWNVVCVLVYPALRYSIKFGLLYQNGKPVQPLVTCQSAGHSIVLPEYTALNQQALIYDSFSNNTGFTEQWKIWHPKTIGEIKNRAKSFAERLPWQSQRLEKPQSIPVMLTPDLYELRKKMIEQGALRSDFLS